MKIKKKIVEDMIILINSKQKYVCLFFLLEVSTNVRNFVKSCCSQEVPVTVSLSCFVNLMVKSFSIVRKFLLEFYHLQLLFWTVGFEIRALVCF